MLADGALRVIIGSSLIKDGSIQTAFAQQLAGEVGADKLIFAVDSKGGRVAIRGWRQLTEISAAQMMRALEPWCSGFLYTHIDTEGLLLGMPLDVVSELRSVTAKQPDRGWRHQDTGRGGSPGCHGRRCRGWNGDLSGTAESVGVQAIAFCTPDPSGLKRLFHNASFAPSGLTRGPLLPTACAVGCIPAPLRGFCGRSKRLLIFRLFIIAVHHSR